MYGVFLAVVADFFASLPTLQKAWSAPSTESQSVYVAGLLSAALSLPLVEKWGILYGAFPLYFLTQNLGILLILWARKNHQ
jgi:hypothetical protein